VSTDLSTIQKSTVSLVNRPVNRALLTIQKMPVFLDTRWIPVGYIAIKSGAIHGKALYLCYLLNSKAVLPFGYFLLPFGNRASTFGNQHKAKTRRSGRADAVGATSGNGSQRTLSRRHWP
jgi:hypothetical protein